MRSADSSTYARPSAWTWWAFVAGSALLAEGQWLHTPRIQYLVVWLVATVVSIVAAWRIVGAERRWALACSLLLGLAGAVAAKAERTLVHVQRTWEEWRADNAHQGLAALKAALDDEIKAATRAASTALTAPADRGAAFAVLDPLSQTPDERGVILYRGDTPFAWSGVVRSSIDPSRDGITVMGTSFYLAIQYTQRAANSNAVVVSLIDAIAPANRLASPLAQRVANEAGLRGFLFTPPSDSAFGTDVLRYAVGGQRIFDVRANSLQQGEVSQRVEDPARARAGIAFAIALVCFVIGVWRGTRRLPMRAVALAVGLLCVALVPLSQGSNLTRLFDPAVYFTPKGGPLTANAGALTTTGAIVLLGVLGVTRRQVRRASRWRAVTLVLLVAVLGPFLLRELARGVVIPPRGVDASLWLIWEVPLFLAAVSVLLTGAAAGATALGPRRGLPPWVAPAAAAIAATLAPIVWDAPGRWPWWYTLLWMAAIGMLALSRRTRYVLVSAAAVASLGATTLVWARTAKGRVNAAERDLASLTETDSVSVGLLRRFGRSLARSPVAGTREGLLQQFVMSDIASAGNPIAISSWANDSGPVAHFETADFPIALPEQALLAAAARQTRSAMIQAVPTDSAVELVMAVPSMYGGVTVVVLAPKTRLFNTDPFARLLGLDVDENTEPPYTVRLRARLPADTVEGVVNWRREGYELHGDWFAHIGTSMVAAHVEVELRPLDALIERGALIVLLDLAIVGALWLASVIADGGAGRWIRARRRTWGRSYRARLSVGLFAFFVVPALAFAVWSYGQLAKDATKSRELLVSETLRSLSTPLTTPPPLWLLAESSRLDSPLFLYHEGELRAASDPLYLELAPVGRFLDPQVEMNLGLRGEETTTQIDQIDGGSTLFGFRAFSSGDSLSAVIGAPARATDLTLGRRRRDLGVLVLFATALGALAALWLSGVAARQLARPIGTLRAAAMSLASGERTVPLEAEPTVEFSPVFTAFRRMIADLNASTSALEEAQRRTAAVLRDVASGVVAVDSEGIVTLANPRAESLLGTSLEPGVSLLERAPDRIAAVVEHFLMAGADEETFEITLGQQQLRGTVTRLSRGRGASSSAVLTLDDVSELARAQRVLAWGEMARQVAHEIKNPLTPIRLGVQHLRRARADSRVDFDRVLDQNVKQILAEIDRLDEIARAFSRYGAPPEERQPTAVVDIAAVVREVVSLEKMGAESELVWSEEGVDVPVLALARKDELKEVLLNVLENARHAAARNVQVSVSTGAESGGNGATGRAMIIVRDDGHGIPADVLPRIFEPHFSTRTSGSGLGLAISRQLVDGWGGDVAVESTEGEGTTVTIALREAGS